MLLKRVVYLIAWEPMPRDLSRIFTGDASREIGDWRLEIDSFRNYSGFYTNYLWGSFSNSFRVSFCNSSNILSRNSRDFFSDAFWDLLEVSLGIFLQRFLQ